ncbi:hypothetical protein HK104_002306 [Borealophlyctis nickersoniae]|nr:hypothetical protein HK104_002306 [Borealophlyctis nickersoniae]
MVWVENKLVQKRKAPPTYVSGGLLCGLVLPEITPKIYKASDLPNRDMARITKKAYPQTLVASKVVARASLHVPLPVERHLYVWPFVAVYASWFYVRLFEYDRLLGSPEFAWLTFMLCGALHALAYLVCQWSVVAKASFTSRKETDPYKAETIMIVPTAHNGSGALCLIERSHITGDKKKPQLHFLFQKKKYIYDDESGMFKKLDYPSHHQYTMDYYQGWKGLSEQEVNAATAKYGANRFDIPLPSFQELFKEHLVAPFFVFQLFCVALWFLDEMWYYSLFTLVMLFVFESTVVFQRLKNLQEFRSMSIKPYPISVFRNGSWSTIQSDALVPGDIVSVVRQKDDSPVPADMLVLDGSCIANEAMLSGESTPQLKESVAVRETDEVFSFSVDKNHILYGGTKILQVTPPAVRQDLAAPDKGAIAYVLRTGFATEQGKLVRTIVYSTERITANNLESLLFIVFLLVFAIIAAWYVWTESMKNEERKRSKVMLDCILIITSVVPPELPMELSLAVNNSLIALARTYIYCTEPFRIPFAGRVDVACFDKTGTLTAENLIMEGVTGLDTAVEALRKPLNLPTETTYTLAAAHALVMLEDGIIGDPMEKNTLESVEWTLTRGDTVTPKKGGKVSLKLLRRFPFSSALKRMSTVSCHQEGGAQKMFVAVKGAPETLKAMLSKVPEGYDEHYKYWARRGKRVLALGYKWLDSGVRALEVREMHRDDIESELVFAGFLVFHCPLKDDAIEAVGMLNESSHRCVMITGDNALTACHVAKEVEIVTRQVLILNVWEDGEFSWRSIDEKVNIEVDLKRPDLDECLERYDLCCTGKGLMKLAGTECFSALLPRIWVYARVSPSQKEWILTELKQAGYTTLMCGDGTNDVGALKQAHVGIALLDGKPEDIEKLNARLRARRQEQIKEQQAKMRQAWGLPPLEESKDGKPTSTQQKQVVTAAQKKKEAAEKLAAAMEAMGGDMDDVPQIKFGDASVAAPFTSKISSVKSVCNIVRQGRATLIAMVQMYKILALNCLISAYSMSVLYLAGIKQGDWQATIGGMMITVCFFGIAKSTALEKLSKQRPQSNVFNFYVIMSVLGQAAVHVAALIYIRREALIYSEDLDEDIKLDAEFTPNLLNSAVYLVSLVMEISTFAINYQGEPFRESIRQNKALYNSLVSVSCIAVAAAFEVSSGLNDWMQLVPFPEDFKWKLIATMALDFGGAYVVEQIYADSRGDLKTTIHNHGGTTSLDLTPTTSCVLVEPTADFGSLLQRPQDPGDVLVAKLLQDALVGNIPVVTDTYVWQCILSKEVLHADAFEVVRLDRDGAIVMSGRGRPSLRRSASEGTGSGDSRSSREQRKEARPPMRRFHSYHPHGGKPPNEGEGGVEGSTRSSGNADVPKPPNVQGRELQLPQRPSMYDPRTAIGYGAMKGRRRGFGSARSNSSYGRRNDEKTADEPAQRLRSKYKEAPSNESEPSQRTETGVDDGLNREIREDMASGGQKPAGRSAGRLKVPTLDRKNSGSSVSTVTADSPNPISRERMEWQTMLASVLTGDVIRSEKRRLTGTLNQKQQLDQMYQIWLGLRACLRGRSVPEERQRIDERRADADTILEEVLDFTVKEGKEAKGRSPYDQVVDILTKVEKVESLYPSRKSLVLDKPTYVGVAFQHKLDALNSWFTITNSLRLQLQVLKNWTGSEDLLISRSQHPLAPEKRIDTSFIDRILKESGVKRTFEIRIMTVLSVLLAKTKMSMIQNASVFKKMGLPTYINELQQLASFPSNLMEEILKVRLEYTEKLSKHTGVMLDQVIEDFGVSLSSAILIKRECQELNTPADGWTITDSLSPSYNGILLKSLKCYFSLLCWRLKASTESVFFKEAEMLETEWNFMSDICPDIEGGDVVTAEQFCSLGTELLSKVLTYLDAQMRVPPDTFEVNGVMTNNAIRWYLRMLENVRSRARKLLRFHKTLTKELENACEYTASDSFPTFLRHLLNSGHTLVRTDVYANQGLYIFASPSLYGRPACIHKLLKACFAKFENFQEQIEDGYILILSPKDRNRVAPNWQGRSLQVKLGSAPPIQLKPGRIRLVADSNEQLAACGAVFENSIPCTLSLKKQQRAHLESVHRGLKGVKRMVFRLADTIISAVSRVRDITKSIPPSPAVLPVPGAGPVDPAANISAQDLVEDMFSFASDFGWRSLRQMVSGGKHRQLVGRLMRLSVEWVDFCASDCDPASPKTFKWSLYALEFAMTATSGHNILSLGEYDFSVLRLRVARCMSLLISHFDQGGRRVSGEEGGVVVSAALGSGGSQSGDPATSASAAPAATAKEEKKDKQPTAREEISALRSTSDTDSDTEGDPVPGAKKKGSKGNAEDAEEDRKDNDKQVDSRPRSPTKVPDGPTKPQPLPQPTKAPLGSPMSGSGGGTVYGTTEPYILRKQRAWLERINQLEEERLRKQEALRTVGKVLDTTNVVNRNISFLASTGSSISLRWQQGKFLGGGSFGSVYMAINLDTADLMAVKEIRFQDVTSLEALQRSIRDEMTVLQLLHHPNIIEYYGVEVHRDKVYIFMEYCPHSVARLLEHGRFEDEAVVKVYAKQMLKGLEYLHAQGIVHRDVKPANTLIGQEGQIKFVDFGASKIYKAQKTVIMNGQANTLVGTPHYIAPEIITGEGMGRHGAQDIWSLGCCVLEMVTGRKPWSALDNEWAVMYHIGISNRHPPLPEADQLSEDGIDFLRRCFTRSGTERPTAQELLDHPWVRDVDETNTDTTSLDPLRQAAEAAASAAVAATNEGGSSAGSWHKFQFRGGPVQSPMGTPSDETTPSSETSAYGFPAADAAKPMSAGVMEVHQQPPLPNKGSQEKPPTESSSQSLESPSAVVKAVQAGIDPTSFPSPAVSSESSESAEMAWHGTLMQAVSKAGKAGKAPKKTGSSGGSDVGGGSSSGSDSGGVKDEDGKRSRRAVAAASFPPQSSEWDAAWEGAANQGLGRDGAGARSGTGEASPSA